jgi:response regulator NasT
MSNQPGILLISEMPDKTGALQQTLKECGYRINSHISVQDDVIDEVNRCQPTVIVVATGETSQFFMNQLYNLNQENPKPIVIFTDKSESDLIKGAIQAGVSAYVVDGLVAERVKPVIEIARARFEHDQSLRQELTKTRSQLEERKTIERAKGLIMKSRNLSEDEAYKALRKLAMNRNQRLIDVAKDVISVSELLM